LHFTSKEFKPDGKNGVWNPGSKPKDYSGTYPLDFYCTRDKSHKLNFILNIDGEKLSKIGQSPSVLEIVKGDFKHYKNMLGEQFEGILLTFENQE
jgi:hypothetical protein